MKTLYIDTHSNQIELVLFQNETFFRKTINGHLNHSSVIIPLIQELLLELSISIHDLTDIIVINGPGSFTGVRLGVTVAKTLAYTLNIPIRVMSSILIQAISNGEKGNNWFALEEKNGYYVGEFNELDELLNDYVYIKKNDFDNFISSRSVILNVSLDYLKIYEYSRLLPIMNPHSVNPLYVKLIEVQT